ncbi:hypothetical protein AALO_G00034330 [Alosa alosa]|uniref:Uncharacterized protein n=1 Tax=Alosa alosa TaxID=278164 RepID=A0AAV6HCN4_9TELE|nr:uncharacterized protein LOC121709815 [Alosa sapidissima]XP_041949363.1 uncharacterized protein LOC121709815 [Alosa sapidissima]XP_041949364.1 uncharacterized protein LOC121709815 [Alosa sapidissima]XP_048122926.1 uncharacterized protein LOC125309841 [Alosa alosa]KAG5285124.1 hypothetical protein AALO_G00034330 [Alosa alosa]
MAAPGNAAGEMTNAQLIQQLALLNWLKSDTTQSKDILTAITQLQVGREIFNRLTGQGKVEAYKKECILQIADYVQKNPSASQRQLNTEVEKQVLLFAARVQALDSGSLL